MNRGLRTILLPILLTLTATLAAPSRAVGQVATYPFGEGFGATTADLSGNGHTGILTNTPTWTAGKYGSGLSFNATDDGNDANDPRVVVGPSLNIPNLPFTVSVWVNPAGFADWRAILSKRDSPSASNMRLDLGLSAGSGQVYLFTGSSSLTFSYTPPLNAWTHLAVVAEPGSTRLYVDGNLQQTAGGITLGTDTQANTVIGGTGEGAGGDNDPFNGLLDDLRLYNRALSQTEIQTDRNTPAGTSGPPALTITQPASGSTLGGTTTVNVSYTLSGNLTGVDHVHFTLDANPEVMDLTMDGSYQFTNVPAGSHTLNGYLVRANHSKILGTDASPVSFTTTVADTIPPTVSITSPAALTTVSGVITITADASDNATVLGVLFRVGAVDIIPEDAAAPYSVTFNTTTVPNGPHILTAVARDAAGNQTTSDGVPVTVSNVNPNDPAAVGQWSAPFDWPLVAIHMTLMSDGSILAWDDHTDGDGSHVWNPTSNTFTPAPYPPDNLFCSGHTALSNGQILVNGGNLTTYVGIPAAAMFTPSARAWAPLAPMAYPRWYPTTVTLPDGRALTLSGAIDCPDCIAPGGPDEGIAEIPEIYDPVTGSWTQLTAAPQNLPIYPHVFVLPDGRALVTSTMEDPIPTVALDWNAQTWTTVDPVVVDGGSSVQYLPGKLMKSGAAINPDYLPLPSSASTHVLDMTAPPSTWRQTASMAFPRTQHNLTLLPDGGVLVTGGSRNSNVGDLAGSVFEAELWSPATETWTAMARMQTPRLYHSTALLLPDGRVVSAGGGRFGANQLSGELYSPPYLFKGPRPTIAAAPATVDYNSSFTVTTPDAGRIAQVSLVRPGSVTHAINSEQRFVPLTFQPAGGGLTVQAPANGNVAPPGFYMLFIVDTDGVPSVASFVRFPSPNEDAIPPSAPEDLTAAGTVGSAGLAWTASSDNIGVVAYDVHRSTTTAFTPSAATKVGETALTNFTDAGLTAGTYFYMVQARDAVGNTSSPSNEASATVVSDTDPPTIPLGLTASVVSSTRIDLSWTASNDNVRVAGYDVYRDNVEIATATLPAYSDTGLNASTAYSYTVNAFDDAGNPSLPSAPVSATTSGTPPPPADLKVAYAFDEGLGNTTADLSGNGHDGTLTNSPAWAGGKYGNALSFNATDDGNEANDPQVVVGRNLNIPNLPFTVSVWVNPASFADWRAILSKRDSPSASNMRLDLGLSAGSGQVYLFTGPTFLPFSYTPPLNTWTHLAVVAEPGSTRLYVGGNLQQTAGGITLGTDTQANTVIGGTGEGAAGDNDPFKGLLDDLRLYDRALSQTEIQTDRDTPAGTPDTEAPSVSLTGPPAGSTVSGSAVTVSANASDNVSVAGVQFQLDGVNLGAEDTTAPYSISWNTTTATNNAHILTAVARDAAGNSATSTDVVVTVSNPPTLTITQPANGSTLGVTTTVSVSYAVSGDLTGVDHVHFTLDANPEVMDLTLDGSYQFTNVPAGSHTLNGYLVRANHSKILGTDATPVSFTTTLPDTIPPTVSITSPAALSTVSGVITITADADDNATVLGVQFRVGAVGIIPEDTAAPYSVTFNTTTVGNGAHILTAVARDAAGNQTTSTGVTVTVSNLAPTGLTASYGFDEGFGNTTADLSGNGHDGTLTNSPAWAGGKYGNALSFNATDDGNEANDPQVVVGRNLNIPNLPFTVSVWVNPASFADWRAILSKRDSPSASNMRLDLGLSAGSGQVYLFTGPTFLPFSYTPPLNTWTHLAVVAEPGSTRLYVGGNLQQTAGGITLGTDTQANTVIGGTGEGAGGDNDPFKGLLDDLRLYDRALSQAEIRTDRDTQASTAGPQAVSASPNEQPADSTSRVDPVPLVPAVLRVYPNPFRGNARIEAFGGEEVAVYSITGRLVRTLRPFAGAAAFGPRAVDWDGADQQGRPLPSGIYFVKAGKRISRVALLR